MIIVLQRVKKASVVVEGRTVGAIGPGVCLLVGVRKGDVESDAEALAEKISRMRIFSDDAGKMNLALADIGGEALAVSQFTLAASVRKGRRPSFDGAEAPARAAVLFESFVAALRRRGVPVQTGVFQAAMDVHILNDGPVTFIIEAGRDPGPG